MFNDKSSFFKKNYWKGISNRLLLAVHYCFVCHTEKPNLQFFLNREIHIAKNVKIKHIQTDREE